MFVKKAKDYIYSDEIIVDPIDENLFFPIEVDTEYAHPEYNFTNVSKQICQNLTVQCNSVFSSQGIIYCHPDNTQQARHSIIKKGFVAIDYLEDMRYEVNLSRLPSWDSTTDCPWLQIDMYSFYAIAELMRIFTGVYRTDVLSLVSNPTSYGIEQGRRLRTFTNVGNRILNYVQMPWFLTLNGRPFRIRLCIYDTCAVHGMASYASFCENAGVVLSYKSNFNNNEKARMDKMYIERPDDYDNYALGDLHNHDALLGNAENFRKIYESLGLQEYYTPPRLTIGSTVSKIIESSIKQLFNSEANSRDVINAFCKHASADWLKKLSTTTAIYNAKVDGGRCRNNRPVNASESGVLCDIDISSCYGEGLRIQTYPLGIPMIIDYPIKSKCNGYQTLKAFLSRYRKELVPGLWTARVSCKEGYILQHQQDYLVSWFPPKDISDLKTDESFAGDNEWWDLDKVGETKILNNEVHHAIITHEFIQWLENIASVKQRVEMLNNLIVETAMYYPASDRVNSPEELIEAHENHRGVNTTRGEKPKGKTRKIVVQEECYAWYGINLGELLVNQLLKERAKHPKKTCFNDLYKLCTNTVYGDMVSPFFHVGNVVVGNNITARARSLAWCMEKGLHGFQSITDGCVFDLNRVLYPRKSRRIGGELAVNIYADNKLMQHTFKPLGLNIDLSVTDNSEGFTMRCVDDKILLKVSGDDYELSNADSIEWVNKAAMRHLQDLFPGLDILHQETTDIKGNKRIGQFSFEAKGFFDNASFHGSANYMLSLNGVNKVAMRSYSKREKKTVILEEETVKISETENVAEIFLSSLAKPYSIPRSNVYLKQRILKASEYRVNFRKWENTNVYPGVTIENAGLLHEFSLSQFTFQTYAQLQSWRREYERLIRAYNQSYEMYFLLEDGSLNYQKMIIEVDEAIRRGARNFFDGMDKRKAHLYRKQQRHVNSGVLEVVKEKLDSHYI